MYQVYTITSQLYIDSSVILTIRQPYKHLNQGSDTPSGFLGGPIEKKSHLSPKLSSMIYFYLLDFLGEKM
jgi:hypothetical protein